MPHPARGLGWVAVRVLDWHMNEWAEHVPIGVIWATLVVPRRGTSPSRRFVPTCEDERMNEQAPAGWHPDG